VSDALKSDPRTPCSGGMRRGHRGRVRSWHPVASTARLLARIRPAPPSTPRPHWHRSAKRVLSGLGVSACMFGVYAFVSDPLLPQHFIAGEVTLEPQGPVAFDTALGDRLVAIYLSGGTTPVFSAAVAGLTLDFGSCSKRILTLIPVPREAEGTLQLKVDAGVASCGALLRIAKSPGKFEVIQVGTGLDIVLKGRPRLLGDLDLSSFQASDAKSVSAVAGAVLGAQSGTMKIAASAMRLHHLTLVDGPDLPPTRRVGFRADFATADMGDVTLAELNGRDQLWPWRRDRFTKDIFQGLATAVRGLLGRPAGAPGP
jgi:hypothetical protein